MRTDGWTDGHDEADSKFRNIANALKNLVKLFKNAIFLQSVLTFAQSRPANAPNDAGPPDLASNP